MLHPGLLLAAIVAGWAVPAGAEPLAAWSAGLMDIHHISTGRGNAAFVIMPDGTTMLIDAGALDMVDGGASYAPMVVSPQRPDDAASPGQTIVAYISAAMAPRPARIDYAVVTHFHSDHYGHVAEHTPMSRSGTFRLSGMTEVGDAIPIGTIIDHLPGLATLPACARDRALADPSLRNYRTFVAEKRLQTGMRHEPLDVGSTGQIVPLQDPNAFGGVRVRGLKADAAIWSGDEGSGRSRALFPLAGIVRADCRHNENILSLALSIHYGGFTYFSGGDNSGERDPGEPLWLDVETPMARVLGPVDVLTLNHHGNRDSTNAAFLAGLQPRVIVQQSWVSDQPGGEVVHRLASKALYPGPRLALSTYLAAETRAAIGPVLSDLFADPQGHVVIRVAKGGSSFQAYVLDDRQPGLSILRGFGPFASRGEKTEEGTSIGRAQVGARYAVGPIETPHLMIEGTQ